MPYSGAIPANTSTVSLDGHFNIRRKPVPPRYIEVTFAGQGDAGSLPSFARSISDILNLESKMTISRRPLSASDIRAHGSPTSARTIQEAVDISAVKGDSTVATSRSQTTQSDSNLCSFQRPPQRIDASELQSTVTRLRQDGTINLTSNNGVISEDGASEVSDHTTTPTQAAAAAASALPFLASRSTPSLIPSSPSRSSLSMRSSRRIPVPASTIHDTDVTQQDLQSTSTQTLSNTQSSNAFIAPPTRLEDDEFQEHSSPPVWTASKAVSLDHALASCSISETLDNGRSSLPSARSSRVNLYGSQYSLDCACRPETIPECCESTISDLQSRSNSSVDSIFDSPFPRYTADGFKSWPSESMTRSSHSQQESTLGTSATSRSAGEVNIKHKKSFFRWRTTSSSQHADSITSTALKSKKSAFSTYLRPSESDLESAADCSVVDGLGNSLRFGDIFNKTRTIVCFIRHFYCPSCHDYMDSISRISPIELQRLNLQIVVIGCGSWKMINGYRSTFVGFSYPIYSDPSETVYKHLGMTHRSLNQGARGDYIQHGPVKSVALSFKRAPAMPLRNPGSWTVLGGEFVLGPGLQCSYTHRMKAARNHAELSDIFKAIGVTLPTSLYNQLIKLKSTQQGDRKTSIASTAASTESDESLNTPPSSCDSCDYISTSGFLAREPKA